MALCPNCHAIKPRSTVTAEFRQRLRKRLRLHKGSTCLTPCCSWVVVARVHRSRQTVASPRRIDASYSPRSPVASQAPIAEAYRKAAKLHCGTTSWPPGQVPGCGQRPATSGV